MADIVKKVDRGVPLNQRSQIFSQADIVTAGNNTKDIFKINDSLGKLATHIVIDNTGTGSITVRFNVIRTIFPEKTHEEYDCMYPGEYKNLALGQRVEDTTGALITVLTGESFVLDNDLAIQDIQLVEHTAAGGVWTILVF